MSEVVRIPLLHDHHTHPLFYAAFGSAVNLQHVKTQDEAERLLRENFEADGREIAVAHGWKSNLFEWPQTDFEKLPPAAAFNVSLHSLMINEAGLDVLHQHYGDNVSQINDRTWYESNLRVVLNWFANLNASAEAIQQFYSHLLTLGIWSAEELLLVDENEITLFDQAGVADRVRFWSAPDTFEQLSPKAQHRVTGLKLFTDGAIGSRTAALSSGYLDAPKNQGMLIYQDESLLETVDACLQSGKSLAIHAIGDAAIEQCIQTLEKLKTSVENAPQVRIEHAQLINLDLATRAKELGLTLSMQPNFSSDSVDYKDRLPHELCELNNPFRMLIDKAGFVCGEDLVFGSDGMPHGLEYALKQSLFPSIANQKLTIDEFKAGYCVADSSRGYINVRLGKDDFEFEVCVV